MLDAGSSINSYFITLNSHKFVAKIFGIKKVHNTPQARRSQNVGQWEIVVSWLLPSLKSAELLTRIVMRLPPRRSHQWRSLDDDLCLIWLDAESRLQQQLQLSTRNWNISPIRRCKGEAKSKQWRALLLLRLSMKISGYKHLWSSKYNMPISLLFVQLVGLELVLFSRRGLVHLVDMRCVLSNRAIKL